jgi:hypothetical protein
MVGFDDCFDVIERLISAMTDLLAESENSVTRQDAADAIIAGGLLLEKAGFWREDA